VLRALFRSGGRRPRLVAAGLAFLGLAVVLALTRPAPVAMPAPERLLRQVTQASGAAGGVIAWGRPGEVPQIRAVGLADRATGRAMQPADRFRLASLTKPVVAAALHDLAARGVVSLDDPIAGHVPGAPPGITIAQAMTHLGGWDRSVTGEPFLLSDAMLADRHGLTASAQTCGDIAGLPAFRALQHRPGTTYAYSNLGYCWLGAVIEGATGAPWLDAARSVGGAALSLDPASVTVAPAVHPDDTDLPVMRPTLIGPAGGLIGDAATVLAFALREADGRAADPAAAALAGSSVSDYYGRGWRIWPRQGATFYTHFGDMPGTFAFVIRRAEGGAAVVLLNGSVADPDRAARALAADLMALPDWQ